MKKLILLFAGILFYSTALQAQTTEDVKKYKAQKTHNYGELYFGWNNWSGAALDENDATTTELDGWPSTTWGFGFGGDGCRYIRSGVSCF